MLDITTGFRASQVSSVPACKSWYIPVSSAVMNVRISALTISLVFSVKKFDFIAFGFRVMLDVKGGLFFAKGDEAELKF
jgi:hypothetical protein